MKTRETTPGKTYSVHTSSGCTVSDKNGWSKTIDAPDGYFTAHAGEVTIDGDDATDIREVFKLAPYQKLRLLGVVGGNDGLPAGYKQVEYLESTGTQYIMTGFFPDDSSAIEIDINPLDAHQAAGLWMFANADADRTEGGRSFKASISTVYDICYFEFGAHSENAKPSPALGIRRKIVLKNGLCDTSLAHYEFPKQIFKDRLVELSIFRNLRDATVTTVDIYSCLLSKNSKTERHFIPALDATGAPCMFDLVSRKPFYNAGTGDFVYPTEHTTYGLRRVLPDWGKLTEHGLRRLYHAPVNYTGELYDYAMEHGYKPIIETEKPETGYWSPRWTETEDEIVLEWVETEPPMDEFGLPEEDLTETE